MTRRYWRIGLAAVGGCVVLVVIVAGIYLNRIGLDNVQLMYRLHTTEGSILRTDVPGEYAAKANSRQELLKEAMQREGWTYVGQEGSGYLFEKNGLGTIVTARQIWNRHFVQYRVADPDIDLAFPN